MSGSNHPPGRARRPVPRRSIVAVLLLNDYERYCAVLCGTNHLSFQDMKSGARSGSNGPRKKGTDTMSLEPHRGQYV